MKNTLFLTLLFSIFFAQLIAQTKIDLVLIRSNELIETISFFNLKGNASFENMPFSDSIRLDFPSIGDDIFNIEYKNGDRYFKQQAWLGANTSKIYVSIADNELKIESIKGDDTYYKFTEFQKGMASLNGASEPTISEYILTRIAENANSPLSLAFAEVFVKKLKNNKEEIKKIKKILESQPAEVKNHLIHAGIYLRVSALLNTESVDFQSLTFMNRQLEQTIISSQNESYTILDFWFVACAPCVKQHQQMKKDFEADIWNGAVRLIGISTDEDLDAWRRYLNDHEIKWDNYIENFNQDDKLSNQLGVMTYPTYCLLDKNYGVSKLFSSYEELKRYLRGE
jgi:Thioredoxin-like